MEMNWDPAGSPKPMLAVETGANQRSACSEVGANIIFHKLAYVQHSVSNIVSSSRKEISIVKANEVWRRKK